MKHLTITCLFYLLTTSIFAASPNELFNDGGFAAYGDGKLITEGTSAGKVLKMELSKDAVKTVTVELSDISQPPRGQGMLQYMLGGKAVDVPLEEFKTETGTTPASGSASGMTFYPGRGMPHNIATFDAAASLAPGETVLYDLTW